MEKFRSGEDIATLDLLFSMVLFFVCLTALAYMQMRPENKNKANIQSTAQFTVTMEWSPDDASDVDLYMQNPLDQVCYFNNRDFPLFHLDRDDRGTVSDKIMLPNGEVIEVKENKEIISLRGIMKGEYIVNIHQFAMRSDKPTEVKVTIEKLNPTVTKVYQKVIKLEQTGQEVHICRFTIDEAGEVTDVNTEMPIEFVGRHTHNPVP